MSHQHTTQDVTGPLQAAEIAIHNDDYDTAEQATLKALGQIRRHISERED